MGPTFLVLTERHLERRASHGKAPAPAAAPLSSAESAMEAPRDLPTLPSPFEYTNSLELVGCLPQIEGELFYIHLTFITGAQ